MGPDPTPRANLRRRWAPLVLLALWAALLALLLSRHEPWKDELQAWLLARDSPSLGALWTNTRYEGHPLLWHLLLMPLARLFVCPPAMQALHWAIATAAAAVLLLRAPFPLWLRAGLAFSYLPLFEYGVLSRNYSLAVLGIWIACAALAGGGRDGGSAAHVPHGRGSPREARAERPGRPLIAGLGGALAANASPMGLLLAPALAVAILIDRGAELRRRLAGAAVVALGAAAAVIQILPAPDYEHARAWILVWEGRRALYVLRGYAAALLPLPRPELHFWQSSLWLPWPPEGWLQVALAVTVVPAVVLGVAWLVRRSRTALAFWLLGAPALVSFSYLKLAGGLRHHGMLWVVLVAALWLAAGRGAVGRHAVAWVLAPFVAVGLVAAAIAGSIDWRQPFSGTACAARELHAAGLDDLPLVGGVDTSTLGVAAYLPPGRRLYYPAIGRQGTFLLWNLERLRQHDLGPADLVAAAAERDRGTGAILLYNQPLPPAVAAGRCEEVARCAPAVVHDEGIWVYRCGGDRAVD